MTAERPPRPAVPVALVIGPVVAIVLVSVALSLVLVTRHVRQIRAGLIDHARTIATFVSRDAAAGIAAGDRDALRHLASLARAQDHVVYAAIYDAAGTLAAHRGEVPPPADRLRPLGAAAGHDGRMFRSPIGWELHWPLVGDAGAVGAIRLGLSPATLDRERQMAVLTAVGFTILVTLLASAGAVIFLRRHVSVLLAGAALAEEHERVADLKARILTQTSHEFRTPLAVIISASDVLQRYGDRLTSDERAARIEKIRASVRHMTDLIDDVLLFGRTDASRFTPTPTDLAQLCALAVEQARPLAPPEVQLAAVVPATPVPALVDPFLLGQVLRGLLVNAIRYSPDGGTVTLGLFVDEDGVRIAVSDEGMGIPPDDLPRLFEPFQRAGNVGKIPGSGLGLAIARRAIDVHGGTIDAASTLGAGSTFGIRLPASRLVAPGGSAAA